jgi:branched-chain amino acid transport system substrate-binding protein
MRFNVVREMLIFAIELVFLSLVVNLLANSINISATQNSHIILSIIALSLALLLFVLKNIGSIKIYIPTKILSIIIALLLVTPLLSIGIVVSSSSPNICDLSALSPGIEEHISEGKKDLIANKLNEKDREQKIYDNNTQVNKTNSYLLAVAIPAKSDLDAAKAMLAGVADAQTEFNQLFSTKLKKPLKIVVVDDNNDQDFAKKVACQIATNTKWKNILGVIGHYSSGASKAALDIYAKAGITMITPTSTSTSLKQGSDNKVFFRTTITNKDFGEYLADKINQLAKIGKVLVFYEKDNEYAEDLKKQFITNLGVTHVDQEIDIEHWTSANINELTIPSNVKAAVIFPSSGDAQKGQIAIDLIKKLKRTRPDISLFGGDSLYKGRTLDYGKTDIEGLKLVIPWFSLNSNGQMISDYAKKAEKTWVGQTNWMAASSYDATQAFLAAISEVEQTSRRVDRKSVLESMSNVELDEQYTSGEKIKFNDGELKDRKPVFVEVVRNKDNKGQCGYEVCFKRTE